MVVAKQNFKFRFYKHCQTFNNKQKRPTTELSKAFWEAIDNWKDPHIKWNISANSITDQPGAAKCNLCLDKKLVILLADPSSILNKRMELTGKSRHKNKFELNFFLISLGIDPLFIITHDCSYSSIFYLYCVTYRGKKIDLRPCSCASLIQKSCLVVFQVIQRFYCYNSSNCLLFSFISRLYICIFILVFFVVFITDNYLMSGFLEKQMLRF